MASIPIGVCQQRRSCKSISQLFTAKLVKCRLLYVVGQLGAGGLERQLCLLLDSMDRDRYRPEVAVWNFRPTDFYVHVLRKLGVRLHGLASTCSRATKLFRFRQLVLDIQPEVVHSYTFYTNFPAWFATLGTSTVPVGAVRSDLNSDRKACGLLLGSLSARWPDLQIYNNSSSAEKVRALPSFFAPKKVLVVRNALNVAQYDNVPIPANGPVLISAIGSLLEIKRWDRLLTATKILKQRGVIVSVQIAGTGPLRPALENQAHALGIGEQIRFLGHVTDIPQLLAGSTLLAHTSDVEGCPNVVMEAMACGRAVVAMDAGDIRYLVDDERTGFVVRPGDAVELVDRLALLVANRDLCRRMGEAGREKAEREFSVRHLVENTLAGYRTAGWQDL